MKEKNDLTKRGCLISLCKKDHIFHPVDLALAVMNCSNILKDKTSNHIKCGVLSSIFYYNCHSQICLCIKITWAAFQNTDSLGPISDTKSEFLAIRIINVSRKWMEIDN